MTRRQLTEEERVNFMEFEMGLLTSMHNALKQKSTYQIDKNLYWPDLPDGQDFYDKLKEGYANYVISYYQSTLETAKININRT